MPPIPCAWKRLRASRWAIAGPFALALAIGALAGCATAPAPAPRPAGAPPQRTGETKRTTGTGPAAAETTATPPRPGYEAMRDSVAAVDPRGLAGRRIVLDPGHGGFFPGSVGPTGLTEAAVNLGVARALRTRLAAAGAEVFLTRDRDRDFLSPGDSTLRADLTERMRLANAWHPDLFLSIHHNADATGRHDVNETQTYYKLGDDGVSLDAAQDVHASLVRNLGITTNQVVPGNYFVVRTSDAPALLTESSYLTYPPTEQKLKTPEAQQLEADALYVGLARFFRRPAPRIAEFVARADDGAAPDTSFDLACPLLEARIEGAFDLVRVTLDGAALATERFGDRVRARQVTPLGNGDHVATLSARLGGGGSARDRTLRFRIARPVASLRLGARPALAPRDGGWIGLRVELLDRFGLPAADTSLVRVTSGCAGDAMRSELTRARDGVAWAYTRLAAARERARHGEGCARPSFRASLVPGSGARGAARSAGAVTRGATTSVGVATLKLAILDAGAPLTPTAFLVAMPGDTALRNAAGTREPTPALGWINRDGFACLAADSAGHAETPHLAGWRPWARDTGASALPERWSAIAGGALIGRRFTLDPDGGGEDAAGTGPSGSRGALLALEEARILAGLLTAAGAEVKLTREGDAAPTEVERVQTNEEFRSDRFVRLSHRPRAPWLGYYYASPTGKAWARHTAFTFGRLGLGEPVFGEDPAFVVRQVSCPALLVDASPLADSLAELRLLAPGALRAEAYAVFVALAHEFATTAAEPPVDSLRVRDAGGAPVPGAFVVLGGTLVLETGADGVARFARTEAGPIEAEVDEARVKARRVLLDSMRGAILAGPGGR